MPVVVRSLVNYPQTISGQTIPPNGQRTYGASTSALVTAQSNGLVKLSTYDDPQKQTVQREQKMTYALHLTAETEDLGDDVDVYVCDAAGTIAAHTVNMPANPFDGMEVTIATTQVVTALTVAATGKTIKAPLTAGTANGFAKWRYREANTTWYRVG